MSDLPPVSASSLPPSEPSAEPVSVSAEAYLEVGHAVESSPADTAGVSCSEEDELTETPPPPPDVLARWDARLQALWSPRLSVALNAVADLFAPEEPAPDALLRVEEHVSAEFWRLLTSRQKRMPSTAVARYHCVVATIWRLLRAMRQSPSAPFVEEHLAVALRAVRRLRAGMLMPEVCAALYDYHRGWWGPYLTKPQLWILRCALTQTMAALPPEALQPFWDALQSPNPMMQHSMALGLEFLRTAHAVPQLLSGLEYTRDHAIRSTIVEALEQIADPHALGTLARLRRETATTDWTLSRQIARTIRVIEQQNSGSQLRTLLRSSSVPADYDSLLLRPAPDASDLLRPSEQEDIPQSNDSIQPG